MKLFQQFSGKSIKMESITNFMEYKFIERPTLHVKCTCENWKVNAIRFSLKFPSINFWYLNWINWHRRLSENSEKKFSSCSLKFTESSQKLNQTNFEKLFMLRLRRCVTSRKSIKLETETTNPCLYFRNYSTQLNLSVASSFLPRNVVLTASSITSPKSELFAE